MEKPVVVAFGSDSDRAAFAADFGAVPRAVRSTEAARYAPPDAYWASFLDAADAKAEAWLVRKNGRPVGRVGATISGTREGVGYVGFYENDLREPDAEVCGQTLVDAACDWLRASGVRRAYGPIDRNTWFSYRYGFSATAGPDGLDEPSFAWEPLFAPGYVAAFRAAGFTDVEQYRTVAFRRPGGPSAVHGSVPLSKKGYDVAVAAGITFRPFKGAKHFNEEFPSFHALASEGFRESFLFEPISLEQFGRLYQPFAALVDYEGLSYFAADKDGNDVGFLLAFRDRDYLVFKTLMVKKEHRVSGVGHALMYLSLAAADARGIPHGISALVRQGNRGMDAIETRHMADAASWRHDYVLLEKELAPDDPTS